MGMKNQKALPKTTENTQSNAGVKTSRLPTSSVKEKNPNNIKKRNLSSALSSKEPKNSTKLNTEMKTQLNIADKFQPLPLLALKTKVTDTVRKKIVSSKVLTRSKNRKLHTTTNTLTKFNKQSDNQTIASPQSSFVMELPKFRKIIDNMTSFVKIDHEKMYPLLVIFIDYVQELLPDRLKQNSLPPEEVDSVSKELKDIMERYDKQNIMVSLISPGLELDNVSDHVNKTDYSEKLMEHKLNNLLPILRKCNGDLNYTDKNGQTVLHIFIKRYVITHRILSEEELIKPEYKKSPEEKLRTATFHVIEALLEKGASVDIADEQGNTALHTLAKYDGYEEIMKLLLEHSTEMNKCNKNGDTILHLMLGKTEINQKHLQNINVLVNKGADIYHMNNNGKAPIHLVFEFCHFGIFSIFEKKEADFNLRTKDSKTSLHLVCMSPMRDDIRKIKMIDLLISKGLNVNDIDNKGYSALHYAAKINNRGIIERLISQGANTFCQIKEMNLTPLHLASQFGCSSAINTLIQAGMDVNNVAMGGIIPLHLAILHSDPLTSECLIVNGADIYRRDAIFNFTPMHMTAFACRKKLDLLVKKGTDINVKNGMGITPLHLASMLGNFEIVESLCEYGADINCRDNLFGMTPLHWASMKGKRLNLSRIINGTEYSEDEVTISEFWKPLFLMTCQNCDNHDNIDSNGSSKVRTMFKPISSICTIILQPKSEVMKILLKFGAYADLQDNDGRVAIYNVVKNDNVEGMKYCLECGMDFNNFDISRRILNTWNSVKVRSYILWNAMKLRVAELPVAEAYVSKVVKPQFQCYYDYWEDEVKKMKIYMIDDKVSLYDLLCLKVKCRAVYVERVLALQRDLETNFPAYYSLILASCRQAAIRMNLEKLAKIKLLQMSDNFVLKVCYKRVFPYLSNIDLRTVIESLENIKN